MAGRFGDARLPAAIAARAATGGETPPHAAAGLHDTALPVRLEIPLTPELRDWLSAHGFEPDAV